ncbi:FCD domain-containing protein [Pontibacter sp. JAM-7]|uniref:FCD domain-containing protein n=1 Tax=Pontibacter sp. JAM-7 TaxID=3366581 RepID=UPI003AF5100C
MTYKRVRQQKLSDVIAQQIEEMVLEGVFMPGDRLPAERELAVRFEVSRPSIREAIQKLVAKGLLESRQGGGNFVTHDIGSSLSDPLLDLFRRHPEARYDLLEFRHALEGVSAYYAAMRGTAADKAAIRDCYAELQKCHEQSEIEKEVEADVAFHLAIASATHNMVLLHMMRALLSLLREHVWDNLKYVYPRQAHREKIHAQHKLLMGAILEGEPERARQAAYDHLAYVEEALLEGERENTRLERALRRSNLQADH